MSNKLLAAIEAEQRRINGDYENIKRELSAGRYSDTVALGAALNRAASSQISAKLQDEWRAKGGK
jgi:hypothetical protein